MSRTDTLALLEDDWVELTEHAVSALTVANDGPQRFYVLPADTKPTRPADLDPPRGTPPGALPIFPGKALLKDTVLSSIWGGVTSSRVWGYSRNGGRAVVSHD